MTDRKRETVKAKFLEAYRGDRPLTMEVAARHAAVNRVTVWRLRQGDPDFNQAVCKAQDLQDSLRLQTVEDCLFNRLSDGTASPAEVIFFLCNRAPDHWRHVATIKAEAIENILHLCGPLTHGDFVREVMQRSDCKDRTARTRISAAVNSGEITKDGNGRYAVA